MDASQDLHATDLSRPSGAWLERLLALKDLEVMLKTQEGPRIFAEVSTFPELQDGLGIKDPSSTTIVRSPSSELPDLFRETESKTFPRDPEEWRAFFETLTRPNTATSTLIIYLQNPQFYDGATMQPEMLVKFLGSIEPAKKNFDRIVILCDETLGSFSWELSDDSAQFSRLPHVLLAKWEAYLCFRPGVLIGAEAQKEPALLWPIPHSQARWYGPKDLVASPLAWKLLQRDLNQGIELVRFRHLAMRNLKLIGNALSPLVASKKIEVEHWPLSGLYLSLRCLGRQNEDASLLRKRLEKNGLKLYPHSLEPGHVAFCFLLDHQPLGEALKRLTAGLELL